MELRLERGEYIAREHGGLESISGADELRQRVEMKLAARRGCYPLMPEYGSRLYTLSRVKPSQRQSAAEQFIAEAISDEPGLEIEELTLTETGSDSIRLDVLLRKKDGRIAVTAII